MAVTEKTANFAALKHTYATYTHTRHGTGVNTQRDIAAADQPGSRPGEPIAGSRKCKDFSVVSPQPHAVRLRGGRGAH